MIVLVAACSPRPAAPVSEPPVREQDLVVVLAPPSAVPEPTPAASPTPAPATPAPVATAPPSATPHPIPPPPPVATVWSRVRDVHPWVPELRIREDGSLTVHYLGIRDGAAVLSIQEGASYAEGIVWHEAGHAAFDVALRLTGMSADELLAAYWTARRFPGTWQEQQRRAEVAHAAGVDAHLQRLWPYEMFADSFAAAWVDGFREGPQARDVQFDRTAMRAFFRSLPTLFPEGLRAASLALGAGEWTFAHRVTVTPRRGPAEPAPALAEVWAVGPDGRGSLVLRYATSFDPRAGAANRLGAQLSPDGRRLVLSVSLPASAARRDSLVVLDLATGASRPLAADPAFDDRHPAWAPDGSWIAFVRRARDGARREAEGIWLARPDGTAARRLSGLVGAASVVHGWTADARAVAVGDPADGSYALVALADGAVVKLADRVWDSSAVAWGSRRVALAVAEPDGTYRLEVAEGLALPRRTLAREAGVLLADPRWHPDGSQLLYAREDDLFLADTGTGATRPVLTAARPLATAWSPSGAILYARHDASAGRSVRRLSPGGDDALVLDLPARPGTWDEVVLELVAVSYR